MSVSWEYMKGNETAAYMEVVFHASSQQAQAIPIVEQHTLESQCKLHTGQMHYNTFGHVPSKHQAIALQCVRSLLTHQELCATGCWLAQLGLSCARSCTPYPS